MPFPVVALNVIMEDLSGLSRYKSRVPADVWKMKDRLQVHLVSLKDILLIPSSDRLVSLKDIPEIGKLIDEAGRAVDNFVVLAAVEKSRCWIPEASITRMLQEAGRQFESLVDEIENLTVVYLVDPLCSAIAHVNRRPRIQAQQASFASLVGHEKMTKAVLDLLCNDSKYLEIVPLVGIQGLGKTVLAKGILNDPVIQTEFPIRFFIHVSQEYDFRDILMNILSSCPMVSSGRITKSEEELVLLVREQLRYQKYLIIMDDVREREDWDRLKAALSNNKMGSGVLITTRNQYVAAHANPCTEPFVLRPLTYKESEDLFRSSFGEANVPPLELEMDVAHVTGLPLAITLTATLRRMFMMRSRESAGKYLFERGAKFVPQDVRQYEKMISIIYQGMDIYMKACFLYLGIFPKGFEIPVPKLLRLWIAEGLLLPQSGMKLEDEGELILKELVSLNLVRVGKRSLDGRVKTCGLYEIMVEFCKCKAIEESFFQEGLKTLPRDEKPRRICISSNKLDSLTNIPFVFGTNLHSFLATKKKETLESSEKQMDLICKSTRLRVLDVSPMLMLPGFPTQLFHLIFLKYIAMRGSIRIIPSQVSTLLNLETLEVETTFKALDIRAKLWKMPRFRHLLTDASAVLRSPADKKEMLPNENTQTLSTISPENCRKDVFECTPRLRKLGVRGDLALLNCKSLCLLEHLRKLKLLGGTTRLQNPVFPPSIEKLTLMNTWLSWSKISILGKLESLKVLKLKENAFVGDVWTTNPEEFKVLEVLHLGKTDLRIWEVPLALHFPMLKCLFLEFCDALQGIPQSLADIPDLREIKILGTGPEVAATAKKIQELKHQSGIELSFVHAKNPSSRI